MKYCGIVGYIETKETVPGVWEEEVTERKYYGDVLRNARRWDSSGNQNDNLRITNEFSILADGYAYQNFHAIRYIEWMGTKWKVTNVTVDRPRLTLSVGDEWNGEENETTIP